MVVGCNFGVEYLIFYMSVNKRSMDEISLELTERCIELQSRKFIPSEVALDYSQTQLSIQEPQDLHTPIHTHIHHLNHESGLPRIDPSKIGRYAEQGDALYGIESPEGHDRGKTVLHMYHQGKTERLREHESVSLQSKINRESKHRTNDYKNRCRSLGNKPTLPPKLVSSQKENQKTYQELKLRLQEERRKYQPFKVTFRGWEYKKNSHLLGEGEKQSSAVGVGDFLAKRIRLDYNQAQEKKYLQRIILNRQSILHVSQRLSRLPNIQ